MKAERSEHVHSQAHTRAGELEWAPAWTAPSSGAPAPAPSPTEGALHPKSPEQTLGGGEASESGLRARPHPHEHHCFYSADVSGAFGFNSIWDLHTLMHLRSAF